ncbi:MAG: SOS response-associated peptidase [Gammaproteobacteria bacterium]|nr:SOS response-associated peptidase [Gammaproteobacteria bacterium]
MCGRYTLHADPAEIATAFDVAPPAQLAPRYNIAPTQPVPIVLEADGERLWHLVNWGLVPSWARDPKMGARMINARAETVAEKPAFRAAFRRRRCLVPASGYYEWQVTAHGKQPWYIHPVGGGCLAFAGLWEHWEGDGTVIESCTILTCAANASLAAVHDRMPVILAHADFARWLAPETAGPPPRDLLRAAPEATLALRAVSKRVNSPRHEGPECIRAVGDGTD